MSSPATVARRAKAGSCSQCDAPRLTGSAMCEAHLLAFRARNRLAKGCQPWRPGGRGRPPIGAQR